MIPGIHTKLFQQKKKKRRMDEKANVKFKELLQLGNKYELWLIILSWLLENFSKVSQKSSLVHIIK